MINEEHIFAHINTNYNRFIK